LSVLCAVPLMGSLLGGCISANTPGDLVFASAQVVDLHDQAELPGPGASPIVGMVNSRDLERAGQSVTGGDKPHRPLLKIEFTSATDLSKFVIENSYNLGNAAFFCDREKGSPYMSYPAIFWRGVRLGEHEANPIERRSEPANAPIIYYFFLHIALPKIVPSNPPQNGFDLRQKPEDVCFYVRGGNESGSGYRSNTVAIPKDVIVAALAKAPPSLDK
jgi:hypothetical protein